MRDQSTPEQCRKPATTFELGSVDVYAFLGQAELSLSEEQLKQLEIERERKIKDQAFKDDADSPIPCENKDSFAGLRYYPVDRRFRFRVQLRRYDAPEVITMITSLGSQQQFIRVGFFEFLVKGIACRLQVYKSAKPRGPEERLFIPFRDKTSGIETYAAARYIDIPENEKGTYELDFNKAYNPYCAYTEAYVCPLSPTENWLTVEIRAGEKMYKQA